MTTLIRERKISGGLAIAILLSIVLMACGGGSSSKPTPVFETQIISDPVADGDISLSSSNVYEVTSADTTGSVLAGIDPTFGDEFRGFLDFYLGGVDGVPLNARIESATLSIFISAVTEQFLGAGVPLLIDLVSFQPPDLIFTDFDRTIQPPLRSLPIEISALDAGRFVNIDVTSLMVEAQRLQLPDFQVRFLLDNLVSSGLVEIEDSALATAPLLTVTYY